MVATRCGDLLFFVPDGGEALRHTLGVHRDVLVHQGEPQRAGVDRAALRCYLWHRAPLLGYWLAPDVTSIGEAGVGIKGWRIVY